MSSDAPRQDALAPQASHGLFLVLFTATVFVSALLLFAVQPMFTRMVLPRFGGSPSVWSVAMVFFQSMLLAGYAYAHALTLAPRRYLAPIIHLGLLGAAAITLPLGIPAGWTAPPPEREALWLLLLFAVSLGLPFFALAANNPLLQAWFSRTAHRDSGDPYFLYAASNAGSLLALLSYPFLIEPTLTLGQQARVWTVGFGLLALLIAACAYLAWRNQRGAASTEADAGAAAPAAPVAWAEVGRWVALSAIPSGLLVAVTAHIATDVASAPLLWVIPLSIYLLSWILVFQTRPVLRHAWMLALFPPALAVLAALQAFGTEQSLIMLIVGQLPAFFIITMACHGELAHRRPAPERLTQFYLAISFGGMLGGLFCGLIAPNVFTWVAEYPILIAGAALCRLIIGGPVEGREPFFWMAALAALAAAAIPGLVFGWHPRWSDTTFTYLVFGVAIASFFLVKQPLKFALALSSLMLLAWIYPSDAERSETLRSFFGVLKISETADGRFRLLTHGSTVHGAQEIRSETGERLTGRPEPLTYYHRDSPMAAAIAALRARKGGKLRVGVVGLGTGSLACYMEQGEDWRFFEIDPDVIRVARDPKRFTFLQQCAPDLSIVLGDARLTLGREPDAQFDLIIVDAFSSDAIPVHLLTREAMQLYKAKVAGDGAVLLHVSNRYLELASVGAGIAGANGLRSWVNEDSENTEEDDYVFSSSVVIAARAPEHLGELPRTEGWETLEPTASQRVWTDDYSNVVGAIVRRFRED